MEIRMMYDNYYASFVNLDHRQDRLTHMLEQQNRISLPMTRTRGMKPQEVLDKKLATIDQVGVMMRRTEGAVGCHYSQVQVMKDALTRDKHACVFEDDCVFCEDFDKRFEYIHNWIQSHEWDVIWLGASFHCNPPYWHKKSGSQDMRSNCSAELGYDAKLTDDPRMVQTFGAFATFAYIVNKNSIKKILDLFDQHIHKSIGIDWLFILLQPQLKCFSFVPGCVKQMDNQSDIGNGITRWSGFLQLNGTKQNSSYVYQERMEDFQPESFDWKECR
jgi:GR25 family glycosyltransferase involved in LPS biosynthesis